MTSVYERLGVEPLINAHGTLTTLGGSLMAPEVIAAVAEAARCFVDVADLHDKAAARVAEVTGTAGACLTSGASAALTVATAALIARGRPEVAAVLPDLSALPPGAAPVADVVIVPAAHRVSYDRAIPVAGARLVQVGTTTALTTDELAAALDRPEVLLAFYCAHAAAEPGSLPLPEFAAVAHRYGIPVLVDAAAELPPVENLHRFLDEGADLVVFSGGKEIAGPQASGLILGDAQLTAECRALVTPFLSVARGMKIDKETIVGLLTAVELWVGSDHEATARSRQQCVDTIVSAVADLPGVSAWCGRPDSPGVQPVDIPRAYVRHDHRTAESIRDALRQRRPAIAVGVDGDRIAINPQCLRAEDLGALVAGLTDVLTG